MSDVGIYDAIEAEIVTALTVPAIDHVKAVVETCSLADLWGVDAKRFPAIGVIERSADRDDGHQVQQLRPVRAATVWDIAIIAQNMRGSAAGRKLVRFLMESVRDRLHGLQTQNAPRTRYVWVADKLIDNVGDGSVAAAVSTFTLVVNFAR